MKLHLNFSSILNALIFYRGLLLEGTKRGGGEKRRDGKKKGQKRITEVEKEWKDA